MSELAYFRHRDSGGVHGFTLPLHEDLANQVKKGILQPCPAPAAESVRSVILTPEQEARFAAADLKESKAEKRARLRAALEALGDDDGEEGDEPPTPVLDVVSSGAAVAGDAPDDSTPQVPRRARGK